jgi:kumamolisin
MTDQPFEIPGSARRLDSEGLRKLGAHEAPPKDVSEEIIQVTVLLRPDPAAGNPAAPGREALRAARRPSQVDVDNVVKFANANGLVVVDPDRVPRMVVLSGMVSKVAAAFETDVKVWREPWPSPREQISSKQGQPPGQPTREFRKRPIAALKMPAVLRGRVQGVFGIDDRKEARMQMHITPDKKRTLLLPRAQQSEDAQQPEHTVGTLADFYKFPNAEFKGRGQTIAILSLGGRLDRDAFGEYCSSLGIEVIPEVVEVPVDRELPELGDVPDEDAEVALDVYVITALVPSARIVVWCADNSSQGALNGLARAIYSDKLPASVISMSWGSREDSWTPQAMEAIDDLLADATVLGITVCCASGDRGSSDGDRDGVPHVDFPASSPHVLSCGGTTMKPDRENQEFIEVVWNEPETGLGSGGGESSFFPKPEWQKKRQDLELNKLETGRGVPDVAGFADPRDGLTISVSGQEVIVGGTSAVAPLWAGLIARLNEKLGRPVGYLNPRLYLEISKEAFAISRSGAMAHRKLRKDGMPAPGSDGQKVRSSSRN